MFMIEIAGLKILFTGDYSREDDRHLVSAEVPPVKPDILICESTYGTASHMPRLEKEARLMKLTTEILLRGGRVLMPVFALGRAQELLLILDEYWEKYPAFQAYPIYYASNLARKCMDVYRTYINTMNDKIKRAMFEGEGRNPWDFKWIRSLKNIERFEDVGGCVMLASPGMLQVGTQKLSSVLLYLFVFESLGTEEELLAIFYALAHLASTFLLCATFCALRFIMSNRINRVMRYIIALQIPVFHTLSAQLNFFFVCDE
jgi:predicted metal-dependent RNase